MVLIAHLTVKMLRPGLVLPVLCRYLSSTEAVLSSSKKNLQQLRKRTGFSFANCRKALDKFGNDLNQAEAWLQEQAQKEGWSKATKLKGRTTAQGLIGVMREGNQATMVEVNCETDFVAKNSEFQGFVGQAAAATLRQFSIRQREIKDSTGVAKILYSSDEMKEFSVDDQKNLQDQAALTIGKIGENMTLNRALCMMAPADHFIGTYVHSVQQRQQKSKCMVGKYGALVAFRRTEDALTEFRPDDIGRRLCQHIVGMSPLTVGEHAEVTKVETTREQEPKPVGSSEGEDSKVETEMLRQEYLLDPTITVGELIRQESLEIVDFARFECGESSAAVGDS
ncbi:elongation factor Ts, mitochondrial-like [Acanthaster planci]|uniref:Elongation factor Ts, mitochondrial n=1 Tax=Acanthaster planci TaxID=133434 RepID=A0A8B7XGP7_ACAPL|nr:elongation factor Ts, mitochondrial-like [Acanthaster planci]